MKRIIISIADLITTFIIKNKDNNFLKAVYSKYRNFILNEQKFTDNIIFLYFVDNLPSFKNITLKKNLIVGDGFVFDENTLYLRRNLYSFENFLRVFYSYKLTFNNGFLIHSAGSFLRNEGYIFIGKSGSGKTTISELIKKVFYIASDELCVVRLINDTFLVYTTPFWGNFKRPLSPNISFKLKSIYFLIKSKKIFSKEIDRNLAVKRLFKCIVNFSYDYEITIKLMDIVFKLLDKVEFKKLYFNKNKDKVINFLRLSFYK
ncbi:MAG: hypothetical protein N2Z20_05200 [Elusimicrobiales bacterium]|nr:hypothetical protein [Elusimicrobiales bacterium]